MISCRGGLKNLIREESNLKKLVIVLMILVFCLGVTLSASYARSNSGFSKETLILAKEERKELEEKIEKLEKKIEELKK
jgi:hypothetical protein